jgi:hypothetical protein
MSLQLAANDLSAQGRGSDSTLVHMSPSEVNSLQGLAMAHGGSLTINPQTGLPEAGFLSSILPMVAGAALMATGVGAPAAAMIVGGGMTAATGSLQKGIVAGLGAYGGAGLAGGLMSAGTAGADVAANAANMESMGSAWAQDQAAAAALPPAGAVDLGAGATELSPKVLDAAMANQSAMGTTQAAPGLSAAYPGVDAIGARMTSTQPYVAGLGEVSPSLAQSLTPTVSTAPAAQAGLAPTTSSSSALGEGFSKMVRGGEALGTPQGQDAFMKKIGGAKGLMQTGLAAAAPMMTPREQKPYVSDSTRINYRFDPNRVEDPEAGYSGAPTGQRRYFNQTYTRLAGGGITSMADGGYSYDPTTKTYKKISPEKPKETSQVLNALDAGGFGGDISVGGETLGDFGHGYGAGAGVGAIGLGQGLSGMGMTGVGGAIADAGIATLGAMEAQAAADATAQGYGGYGGGGHGGAGGDIGGGSGVGGAEGGYGGGEGGGGYARGGLSHLGDYSDGGRLLRGPGDGVSDSIPAVIGKKRPARLADGEFVVPARIVSELGNGSTEAGARKLYAMMDRVQRARGKTTGKSKVAKNTRADKYLPA